jgi:hypothetical protein
MANRPRALAAAGGDGSASGILESTAFTFNCGITAGLGNGTDEIRSEDWAFLYAHNRCSISQRVGNTPRTTARVTAPKLRQTGERKIIEKRDGPPDPQMYC